MIRIILVADGVLFRSALAAVLSDELDLQVIGDLSNADDVVEFARTARPDVAVIDLDSQWSIGVEFLHAFCAEFPDCSVVGLTTVVTPRALRRAIVSQVRGLVSKDSRVERLVKTIRQVADGKRVIEPAIAVAALRAENPFTPRELDVLRLAAEGMPASAIAGRLFLSPGTVRNYLSAIVRKTGVGNRMEAIRTAERAGWL